MRKKKGIFFTLIAITIMALFILIFTPQADVSLEKDEKSVAARISSIDNYVNDLQNRYLEDTLRASTYKAILSMIYYMNATGNYMADLDSAFYEVILNGTIIDPPGSGNHENIDSIIGRKIMENSTLSNWSDKITLIAMDALNVNTTIKVVNASVYQNKPWEIYSKIDLNLSVYSSVAQWNKSISVITAISIEDFLDPYYLVNTRGVDASYANQIKESGLQFSQWNISHVREHLRNGTYVHWQDSDAPSFLMRFTNTISNSSCCGIESLVNPNKIAPSDQSESYADYLFWVHKFNKNCTQIFNITNPLTEGGVWDEFRFFKLDFNHVTRYNITSNDAVVNC